MYATKTEIARIFGVTQPTVYSRIAGIEKEIGKRYNRHAICDKLVSLAVYLDYEKYHKYLTDKNLRKSVPAFDMTEAKSYLGELNMGTETAKKQNLEKIKESNTIIIVSVDDKKMQKLVECLKEK